ncbi:PTS glucose transporter subunit IIA, partial [Myxococcota bacterium]|nr:PTS glucose transporter subunit IIA [Myxococcota bacterium]
MDSLASTPGRPNLILQAPLSGVCVDLSDVPDPVFAQRMVGDGIAIDPTEPLLRAPCAGRITQLHRAHHALTLTHAEGVEVLMHIGLDTVALGGEGFEPLVDEGDEVAVGDPLLRFEPGLLARRARSLICLIVLPQGQSIAAPRAGRVRGGEALCEVRPARPPTRPAEEGGIIWSGIVRVPNPMGLHARPAAALAQQAKALGG